MPDRDLNIALRIIAAVKGVGDVKALQSEVKQLGDSAGKKIPDPTPELRKGAGLASQALRELNQQVTQLLAVAAIAQFARSTVQEFSKAEGAFRGLESVAKFTGEGIGAALESVKKLTADGLISESDTSKAVQNLLAYGFSIEQATQLLVAFKDAAAFNRASHLTMSEAIVTATEGIKNENSILVDNVGLTKNLSVIFAEFGAKIGKTADELTKAERIQALMTIGMEELAGQAGNAAKAADSLQGALARGDTAAKRFKASVGEALAPAVEGLARAGTAVIESFFKPLVFLAQSVGVRIGFLVQTIGDVKDLVFGDLKREDFFSRMAANAKLAEEQIAGIAAQLSSGQLGLSGGATGRGDEARRAEFLAKLGESAKAGAKAVEDQAKGYERLMDAVRRAFQDGIEQARKLRDEAEKLRGDAAQVRAGGKAKAEELRLSTLPAEQQEAERTRAAAKAADDASFAAGVAAAAAIDGRTQVAEKNAAEAVRLAQLADSLAGNLQDKNAAADLVERAAEAQASAIEAQAKLREQEAVRVDQLVADQAATLSALEKQLDALRNKAANIPVTFDLSKAKLPVISGDVPGQTSSDGVYILENIPARAAGGDVQAGGLYWTGERGRELFAPGMSGSIIPNHLSERIAASGESVGRPLRADFGLFGAFDARTTADTEAQIANIMARVALQKGRRR